MISFKGARCPKSVILYAVYFYVRFAVSYRDLEEITAERGVDVDHATLNRWVEKYSSAIAMQAHRRKAQTRRPWRMDETYVKGLCCTNPARDSSRESNVVAGRHEQTDTPDLQVQKLARV